MCTEIKMINKIRAWSWNIISSGLPAEHNLETLRKIFLLNLIILVGGLFLAFLGATALIQQDYLLGAVDMTLLLFLICLSLYLRRSKDHHSVGVIGTTATGIFYLFLVAHGGVGKTAYVWALTYPLISLFLLGTRWGSFMSFLVLGMMGAVFAFGTRVDFVTSYSIDLILRFIPAYVTIYLFALVWENVRKKIQHRLKTSNAELEKAVGRLEEANKEKERLIHELRKTMDEVKALQGILPICAACKKIRNDNGYWEQVEKYIQNRSEVQFSHSICPECAKRLYPDFVK